MLGSSLRHGFKRLADMSGRDSPGQFWPYAGVVLGTSTAVWMIGGVVEFMGVFGNMQQFARDHPDQVTIEQGPGHYSMRVQGYHPELMPDFPTLLRAIGRYCRRDRDTARCGDSPALTRQQRARLACAYTVGTIDNRSCDDGATFQRTIGGAGTRDRIVHVPLRQQPFLSR